MVLNKTVNIKVRVLEAQAEKYASAAEDKGMRLSSWIREVLDKAAKKASLT